MHSGASRETRFVGADSRRSVAGCSESSHGLFTGIPVATGPLRAHSSWARYLDPARPIIASMPALRLSMPQPDSSSSHNELGLVPLAVRAAASGATERALPGRTRKPAGPRITTASGPPGPRGLSGAITVAARSRNLSPPARPQSRHGAFSRALT